MIINKKNKIMCEKRLVLNFNGKDLIAVGIGQGKAMEVIFTIDGIESGITVSRSIHNRPAEDTVLLPLTNPKLDLLKETVDGFDGFLESYEEKTILFQKGIVADYKLTPETIIDLDYWTPCSINIDKVNKKIELFILSTIIDEGDKSDYLLERFILQGLETDNWEDVDIIGACENIGNHVKLGKDLSLEISVHNRQNVCLFD